MVSPPRRDTGVARKSKPARRGDGEIIEDEREHFAVEISAAYDFASGKTRGLSVTEFISVSTICWACRALRERRRAPAARSAANRDPAPARNRREMEEFVNRPEAGANFPPFDLSAMGPGLIEGRHEKATRCPEAPPASWSRQDPDLEQVDNSKQAMLGGLPVILLRSRISLDLSAKAARPGMTVKSSL